MQVEPVFNHENILEIGVKEEIIDRIKLMERLQQQASDEATSLRLENARLLAQIDELKQLQVHDKPGLI